MIMCRAKDEAAHHLKMKLHTKDEAEAAHHDSTPRWSSTPSQHEAAQHLSIKLHAISKQARVTLHPSVSSYGSWAKHQKRSRAGEGEGGRGHVTVILDGSTKRSILLGCTCRLVKEDLAHGVRERRA
jgi:hypothetical protein